MAWGKNRKEAEPTVANFHGGVENPKWRQTEAIKPS